jgi:hypothetical protein
MDNTYKLLNHLKKKILNIQSDDFKQWVRTEDPTETYKDSLKK